MRAVRTGAPAPAGGLLSVAPLSVALLSVALLSVALLSVALAACAGPGSGSARGPVEASAAGSPVASDGSGAPPAALEVYAAASLGGALGAAVPAYQAAHPGTTISLSTDSSAALEAKIEQGAPADVFLSADTANPQRLVDRGLAAGDRVTTFAGNRLTVIVPVDNPAGIRSAADLARPGVELVAAADSVPIARYANQLVANLARLPGYPADFASRYAANVVSKEDNVAAVVAKVELGEGDAAIVYTTDANASHRLATIDVPADANVAATYGAVVVKASHNQAAARAFLDWLAGPEGQRVLTTFGFQPAP